MVESVEYTDDFYKVTVNNKDMQDIEAKSVRASSNDRT